MTTIGLPYRQFLEKAEREGFEVMEGTAQMRAELKHAIVDLHDSDRRSSGKVGWFDWMNMDIEEHAELKRKERLKNVLDALPKKMRVPPKYMPSFWSLLGLGIFVTLHLFVVLLQHWSVAFQLLLNYNAVSPSALRNLPDDEEYENTTSDSKQQPTNPSTSSAPTNSMQLSHAQILARGLPTHVRVTPAGKKDVLLPIVYQPTLGATFEYHRRKFVWDEENSYWRKVRCYTKMKLSFFDKWQGYSSEEKIHMACIRYGKNEFDVKQPTFSELYKAQLTSPFTVFQLFCVVLWMLDEYWQYSAFTLFMILTFEATVVFSRIKSLGALRGMGNKSRVVYVLRNHKWIQMASHDLLPGDIFSLTRHHTKNKINPSATNKELAAAPAAAPEEGGDMVPADVLLLRGFTVVNEASLTGESVPQMKEGLTATATQHCEDDVLDMKGKDKNHVLYAGTKLLQCKMDSSPSATGDNGVSKNEDVTNEDSCAAFIADKPPPDNGCICFVLRTGFSSAQGKLVRMIEGSQEKVKGHERETGLLLCMLFFFALASSGYVLKKGMENENRSKYELLLHCILILTSVIPPELPMQMAVAVNQSLMTLMRMQVFCTEPFRVPVAGKLDCCLFDKTGTLTTDELVAVGVHQNLAKGRVAGARSAKEPQKESGTYLTPMTQVQNEAGLVLAGCHSLVIVDDEVTGDPLEAAALSAMRWRVTFPDGKITPALPTEKRKEGKPLNVKGSTATINSLEILVRHHFSSKLQRMSCVVKDNNMNTYSVAKGSPEAIGALLQKCPEGFDAESKALAKEGYRVIALAYKSLDRANELKAITSRAHCEKDLIFAGFIAFTCRVRKDTKDVLERLKEGGMSIAMITGDALLTAAHVAKEVGICDSDVDVEPKNELQALLSRKKKKERKEILMLEPNESLGLFWRHYKDDSLFSKFEARSLPELANKYDLMITGKSLALAFEEDSGTKSVLQYIKVFARMKPDEKETVIECLHSVGLMCLMCGDGANDVGALKQADVGVALLSGFGDVNVDKGLDGNDKKEVATSSATAMISSAELEALKRLPVGIIKGKIRSLGIDPDDYSDIVEKDDLIKLYRLKSTEVAVKQHDWKLKMDKAKMSHTELREKQKQEMAEKQKRMMERIKELEAQGESFAHFKALREFMANEFADTKIKKAEMAKLHSVEGGAAMLAAQLEDLETGELPMVKLGDASVAAPFTSKMPSIRSCVDIIRQGRCTLVTSIQMYQILALNCLISAYSLSVLYLDGVKYGDTQMTAMGILGSISFMSVSRSKPLDKLSAVRPLSSIFHPSLFLSLLGQFSMHLSTMILATREAKKHLPDGYQAELEGVFKPGILNSVVFLVSSVQQVTVFVVNLQGKPFMTGLTENRPLLWSLLSTFILTFMFASESIPGLNKYFQLVPFPDEVFRSYILKLLVADVIGAFAFDRLMKFIFAPKILFASFKGTTLSDVFGLIRTVVVIFIVMYMILGNSETWEEMLREEGRLDGESNLTNATEVLSEALFGSGLDQNSSVFSSGEF